MVQTFDEALVTVTALSKELDSNSDKRTGITIGEEKPEVTKLIKKVQDSNSDLTKTAQTRTNIEFLR